MRRAQLEHAVRAACQIIDRREVIVVGSQAILGTYDEDQLPAGATRSVEIDILPIAADAEETGRLADLIEDAWSKFRTRTQRLPRETPSSLAGASTRRTCAWRSCAPCGRRTATSSVRSWTRASSMPE
jgi:hypothetical protein